MSKPGFTPISVTAQVSQAEKQQLERLAEALHMTQARVIRMAVSRLAAERLPYEQQVPTRHACAYCGDWIDSQLNRADKKYCSDSCRVLAYNKRQHEAGF